VHVHAICVQMTASQNWGRAARKTPSVGNVQVHAAADGKCCSVLVSCGLCSALATRLCRTLAVLVACRSKPVAAVDCGKGREQRVGW